jgi:Domain of unknown function (DUF397)
MDWHKSSYSNGHSGECVEVTITEDAVFLRDSRHPDGPVLQFTPAEWATLRESIRAGRPVPGAAVLPDCMRPIELQDHPRRGRESATPGRSAR